MMKLTKGRALSLAYAPQTDSAIIPLTGWKELPYKSSSLAPNYETTASETIRDTRMATKDAVTKATAGGDTEHEFFWSVYDDFMAGMAFNEWTNDILTLGGNNEKVFAIEHYHRDAGIAHLFLGNSVNTMKISISDGAFISLGFGFISRDYQNKMDDTRFAKDIVLAENLNPASPIHVTDLKLDGALTAGVACVKSLEITHSNNMEQTNCIGTGKVFNAGVAEMDLQSTGNIVIAYGKQAQAFVNKQVDGGTISLEFTINFPQQGAYRFNYPAIQVKGKPPSDNGLLNQTLEIKSVAIPPTITRIPAVV